MSALYANENFPFPVVEELWRRGHDVLTIQETGKGGQSVSDEDVLRFAIANRRILLTLDRKHFIRLHNLDASHEGIIVCTLDPDFVSQAMRIHDVLVSHRDLSGILIRINRGSGE